MDNDLFILLCRQIFKDISLLLQESAGEQRARNKPEQILFKLVTLAASYNWVHLCEEVFPLQILWKKRGMQHKT